MLGGGGDHRGPLKRGHAPALCTLPFSSSLRDSTSFPLNGEPRRRNGPRALSLKALLGPGASHGRLPRGVLRCLGV